MSRERVLAMLRERPGEYLSGESMSRTLGISRAGVWKAIEGLRQEGYTIASAPNRGYRLEDAPTRRRSGASCSAWRTPPTACGWASCSACCPTRKSALSSCAWT